MGIQHGLGILSEWWDWAPTFDHHHLAAARLRLDAIAGACTSGGTSKAFALLPHSAIGQANGGSKMNTDQMKGNWKQLVGKAKEKWGKLTDNDWRVVEGKRDQLVGRIQERYGLAREEAERQVAEFERTHERI